jgi:hypothetical protein
LQQRWPQQLTQPSRSASLLITTTSISLPNTWAFVSRSALARVAPSARRQILSDVSRLPSSAQKACSHDRHFTAPLPRTVRRPLRNRVHRLTVGRPHHPIAASDVTNVSADHRTTNYHPWRGHHRLDPFRTGLSSLG